MDFVLVERILPVPAVEGAKKVRGTMESSKDRQVVVTVLIKALNEGRRIAACIEAAQKALKNQISEIIIVDSLSVDETVTVARQYKVRIVQFKQVKDRNCGAAVQLGYQYSTGDFIYILDADMLIEPKFIDRALERLLEDESIAGVGGKLVDIALRTKDDEKRALLTRNISSDAYVNELPGGGLYRRTAIEAVSYLGHRGLPAYEEADLGFRLRSHGWKLLRLNEVSVRHEGHAEGNFAMLRRLWRNGRARATGGLLAQSIGKPWFGYVIFKFKHIVAIPVLHVGIAGMAWGLSTNFFSTYILLWLSWGALFALAKRSVISSAWSIIAWHYYFAAALAGITERRADPLEPIDAVEIT